MKRVSGGSVVGADCRKEVQREKEGDGGCEGEVERAVMKSRMEITAGEDAEGPIFAMTLSKGGILVKVTGRRLPDWSVGTDREA